MPRHMHQCEDPQRIPAGLVDQAVVFVREIFARGDDPASPPFQGLVPEPSRRRRESLIHAGGVERIT